MQCGIGALKTLGRLLTRQEHVLSWALAVFVWPSLRVGEGFGKFPHVGAPAASAAIKESEISTSSTGSAGQPSAG